ncbi:Aste57867_22120 [Aphanomyces stellatus]|uniref:Aste57867_22120 protein n=1 Tax=Aphanomyces stellatus TaxID=120398 RepID=A0A485LJD1_9STRA|nr:hypothetical protein As57867_022051 [Aphanomyces stellatus]VFT98788.1 Aste57867_22120 [Aphanomyces stellatus]
MGGAWPRVAAVGWFLSAAVAAFSIWETTTLNATSAPVLLLTSFNFTNGGSFVLNLQIQAAANPMFGLATYFVICDEGGFAGLQSAGFSRASSALCATSSGMTDRASLLHSLCTAYPLQLTSAPPADGTTSNNSIEATFEMQERFAAGQGGHGSGGGARYFLLDTCPLVCPMASPTCAHVSSLRVVASVLYAMCDNATPRHCTGESATPLSHLYSAYAAVWAVAATAWIAHVYRSGACIFKFHVLMSLALVGQVSKTWTMWLAFHTTQVDSTLNYVRLAATMQLGVGCVTMLVIFGVADGCCIIGTHERGFLLAVLYFGYPLIETSATWNPILSAVMVACVLFMITTLAGRRLQQLHADAYWMHQVGFNPDTSPIGTKARLLRTIRAYAVVYVLEVFVVKLIFWLLQTPPAAWIENVLLESFQFVFFCAVGVAFRCRMFAYTVSFVDGMTPDALVVPPMQASPTAASRRVTSRVLPVAQHSPPATIALAASPPSSTHGKPVKVFTHPDGSRSFGAPVVGKLV